MTTFNTRKPIGSTDARDLSDNAENFDKALNSTKTTWNDRLGVTRDTFEGALSKLSFYRVGTFAAGYTLTNMRQTLEYNGHEYSWAGTFPKVVSAGSTPATSGGIGAGAWVDRTDVTLRSDIGDAIKSYASVSDMMSGRTTSGLVSFLAIGQKGCSGRTFWKAVNYDTGVTLGNGLYAKSLTNMYVNDFGLDSGESSVFDALESALLVAKGETIKLSSGVYDAGSYAKSIAVDKANIYFDNVTVLFSGLTSNDTTSALWSGAALDIHSTSEMNISGIVTFDFQNTYVYRGIRLREGHLRNISGITVKNIRPPLGWKDAAPGLTSGAIVLGAPSNASISDLHTDNVYKYYQDGSTISITSSPETPLSRSVDVQGTFYGSTFSNFSFNDVMMGLLLDTGTGLSVDGVYVSGALSNCIYDLNCEDVTYSYCRIKNAADQGITLSGKDKRIIGCEFFEVSGRPISLHAGDINGLTVSGNTSRNSSATQAEFVSVRADAAAYTRNNIVISGNNLDYKQCGYALFSLGRVGNGCSVNGNNIHIETFSGSDPVNGAILYADGGLVGFSGNTIIYDGANQFLYAFRGSSPIKNGPNTSNCALATFSPTTLQGAQFSNTQKTLIGADCTAVQYGTINLSLPDNIGTKGLGGNYTCYTGDINTFSTYWPATMGASGFRWSNGTNGDYDTIYEVLKPSQVDKTLKPVLRIDASGVLHLKTGTSIAYDL